MIQVLTYDQINPDEWRELVCKSQTGTWFQSPEAYAFFASQPELFRPFAVGIINPSLNEASPLSTNSASSFSNSLRGIAVGYVTQERNALRRFFTRRAIIIGGPALADDASIDEVAALLTALKTNLSFTRSFVQSFTHLPIYIETRNFNDYSRWKGAFERAGFAYKKHLNFHVDTNGCEARLSENRKRQIRKSTAEVSEGSSESDIRQWYEVLKKLYRTKVKTPLFPVDFFLEAYRQGVGKFLLVRSEGKVIGGSMIVADNRCVYEWFECGLNAEYKDRYPSVMATFAGMTYALNHGLERYDMMGAGEPDVPYGVRDFKAEFGGELVEHGRFLCVCKPILYRFGAWGVRLLKKS